MGNISIVIPEGVTFETEEQLKAFEEQLIKNITK